MVNTSSSASTTCLLLLAIMHIITSAIVVLYGQVSSLMCCDPAQHSLTSRALISSNGCRHWQD
jgi:hypothetical protein